MGSCKQIVKAFDDAIAANPESKVAMVGFELFDCLKSAGRLKPDRTARDEVDFYKLDERDFSIIQGIDLNGFVLGK